MLQPEKPVSLPGWSGHSGPGPRGTLDALGSADQISRKTIFLRPTFGKWAPHDDPGRSPGNPGPEHRPSPSRPGNPTPGIRGPADPTRQPQPPQGRPPGPAPPGGDGHPGRGPGEPWPPDDSPCKAGHSPGPTSNSCHPARPAGGSGPGGGSALDREAVGRGSHPPEVPHPEREHSTPGAGPD